MVENWLFSSVVYGRTTDNLNSVFDDSSHQLGHPLPKKKLFFQSYIRGPLKLFT